jgi:hypothetical protein
MRTEQTKSYCSLPGGCVGSFACQLQFDNELKRGIIGIDIAFLPSIIIIKNGTNKNPV